MNTETSNAPESMSASTIVLILMRLFALEWLVQVAIMLLNTASVSAQSHDLRILLFSYAPALVLLALCAWMWMAAPWFARKILGKYDAPVHVSGISLEDIYSFAFVFLGLYFILTSLAASLNWIHYYLTLGDASSTAFSEKTQQSFYKAAQQFVTLLAGLATMLPARQWARKLVGSQPK